LILLVVVFEIAFWKITGLDKLFAVDLNPDIGVLYFGVFKLLNLFVI